MVRRNGYDDDDDDYDVVVVFWRHIHTFIHTHKCKHTKDFGGPDYIQEHSYYTARDTKKTPQKNESKRATTTTKKKKRRGRGRL